MRVTVDLTYHVNACNVRPNVMNACNGRPNVPLHDCSARPEVPIKENVVCFSKKRMSHPHQYNNATHHLALTSLKHTLHSQVRFPSELCQVLSSPPEKKNPP